MTKRLALYLALLVPVFLMLQCGRDRAAVNNQISPAPSSTPVLKKVRVFLFAAGYCEPCKEELPQVRDWYNALPKEKRDQIQIRVYVIAGETTGQQPTQQYAEDFGKRFQLPFEMKADKFARTYRKYYDSGNNVPATVVANDASEPQKIFAPRKVSTEEITQAVNEAAK